MKVTNTSNRELFLFGRVVEPGSYTELPSRYFPSLSALETKGLLVIEDLPERSWKLKDIPEPIPVPSDIVEPEVRIEVPLEEPPGSPVAQETDAILHARLEKLTKAELVDWLTGHDVEVPKGATKAALITLIVREKSR